MAREKDPDSATREFFFNLADNAKLDTPREVAAARATRSSAGSSKGWML